MNDSETVSAPAPAPRRSLRDWIVDTCLFLAAVLLGLMSYGERVSAPIVPEWLFHLDQVAAALGCAALWLRRRWPVELAVALTVLSVVSELAGGALLVALFTVAVHRPPRTTAVVFALSLPAALLFVMFHRDPAFPAFAMLVLGVGLQTAAVGWGLFVHHRRRLLSSLRERAVRAETEARLRAEQARYHARQEIAREIHDVLGHRLSLLSVHAGALEFNPGASAEDIARAARVIRQSAHGALQDLREVVGVLRAPVGELPQPTLDDLRHLAAESDGAGMRVELREETSGAVPESAGRTAYRIVQEGLTNVRKHAPGAEVRIRVAGEPGAGLTVEVRDTAPATVPAPASAPASAPVPAAVPVPVGSRRLPDGASAPPAGSGQGLTGLAERVALAEGRLEYGPAAGGGWRLAAWLPWPP
ncbi:sensor histidine kinase [Planomonospora corallina]|uniref:histidine kinase n=1 Tax=Planomonospora corallina TaxID=1806052 RepID=A0ABV8IDP4_9ACTN